MNDSGNQTYRRGSVGICLAVSMSVVVIPFGWPGSDHGQAVAVMQLQSTSGEITVLGDSSLTYRDSDGDSHTVTVDSSTTYTLDGSESMLSSLKVGYMVNVVAQQDGDNMKATSVDATSRVNSVAH